MKVWIYHLKEIHILLVILVSFILPVFCLILVTSGGRRIWKSFQNVQETVGKCTTVEEKPAEETTWLVLNKGRPAINLTKI